MSGIALRLRGLGKRYRIGGGRERQRTLRDAVSQAARRPIERIRHPGAVSHVSQDLWALRNIDLEVQHGEVLGIVGRNGTGKSTLLKVLSHITEPSEGRVEIRGRVGSLLEVGTGFHQELTGRENIYLNGAIIGMRRAEIRERFDDIVEFSEIGQFLDTPVKRYSSGMYVRLAFAVAAHLEPDVLLIDEVLAVGDMGFQEKCIRRLGEIGVSGRTVLFVSHNMAAVRSLCGRAILLEKGEIIKDGGVDDVVEAYARSASEIRSTRAWEEDAAPGDSHFRMLGFSVRQDGHPIQGHAWSSKQTQVIVRFLVEQPSRKLQVGFELLTAEGLCLFQTFHSDVDVGLTLSPGEHEASCLIPPGVLNEGSYVVSPLASLYFTHWIIRHVPDTEIRFGVMLSHAQSAHWTSRREGALAPALEWHVRRLRP